MSHNWRAIAVKLGIPAGARGGWGRIIAETLGIAPDAPGHSWYAKIASAVGISTINAEERAAQIDQDGTIYTEPTNKLTLSGQSLQLNGQDLTLGTPVY